MKRIVAALLAIIMLFGLCACAEGSSQPSNTPATTAGTALSTTAAPTTVKPTTVKPSATLKPGRTRITWMNYNTFFKTSIAAEDVVIKTAPDDMFEGSANITVTITPKVTGMFENTELLFRLGCDDECWDSQDRYTVKFAEDGSAYFTVERKTGIQDVINTAPKFFIVIIEIDGYVTI